MIKKLAALVLSCLLVTPAAAQSVTVNGTVIPSWQLPNTTLQNNDKLTLSRGTTTYNGVITLPWPITIGGTGAADAASAINALLPSQTGHNGNILGTNGTVAAWVSSGGGGSPGGSTNDVQYKSGSSTFGGVTLGDGQLLIGQTGAHPAAETMSGNVTISDSGVTTIGALQVTNGMLAGSIAASKLVGTDIATVGTITAGTWNGTKISLAFGGTNVDLSATGGSSQVLKQVTTGANITVGQLACSDLSNGATGCMTAVGTSGATIPVLNAANTWSADQTISAHNLITDTTTGMKIGTSTSQKIGFWNATPVVQQSGNVCTILQTLGLASSCSESGSGVSSFNGDGTFANNSSSTGAVTLTLASAAANTVWGNNTGGSGAAGYQTSISVSGTVASAAHTVTSSSATALAIGANGATNPVVSVDASTASVITGVAIKGAATGGTTTIKATDSGSNTGLEFDAKGTGPLNVAASGTGNVIIGNGSTPFFQFNGSSTASMQMTFGGSSYLTLTPSTSTASNPQINLIPHASTTLTASTNSPVITFSGAGILRQHATGSLTLQADYVLSGTDDSFVGASTLTDGAAEQIKLKNCSTNGTCTNENGLYIAAAALTGTVANSYGINISAATGPTTNYAARLNGLVTLPAIGSDTGLTDTSVCQDTTNHNLYFGTGTLGICLGTSTLKAKHDVKDLVDGLAQITALRPVNYFYKKGFGDNGAREQYGFLAEDTVKVLPKLTPLGKDGKPQSVDILGMVPVLVKAMQEQQKEIDDLKDQIKDIRNPPLHILPST